MWNSLMTLKYCQGCRQSYHLKAVVWFLSSNFSFIGHVIRNFQDIGRGNGNIGWNDLQMSFKVIERGRPTNRKFEYELLLVVYSNFRRVAHSFRDTSCFNAENYIFGYPTWIWRPCRWNAEMKFGARKLEAWTAVWWINHDRRSNRVGTVSECDRQTDRRISGGARIP